MAVSLTPPSRVSDTRHFATLPAQGDWQTLCGEGDASTALRGTLVRAGEITCPACRECFERGMEIVARMLATEYSGEE